MSKPKHTINETFPNDIFITEEVDGENSWFLAHAVLADAVQAYDKDAGLVATYKLVKVENLKLKKTTQIVKVK
jgi:hypothetical protein